MCCSCTVAGLIFRCCSAAMNPQLGTSAYRLAESIDVSRTSFRLTQIPDDVKEMCTLAVSQAKSLSVPGIGDVCNQLLPELDLFTVSHEESSPLRSGGCCPRGKWSFVQGASLFPRGCVRWLFIEGGPGIALMECLGPVEWNILLKQGVHPQAQEPCVLCRRDAVGVAVTELTLCNGEPGEFSLCQVYRNQCYPENDPQTYRPECCIHPRSTGKSGTASWPPSSSSTSLCTPGNTTTSSRCFSWTNPRQSTREIQGASESQISK